MKPSKMVNTPTANNQNQGAPNPKSVSSVVHPSRTAPSASIVSTNNESGGLGASSVMLDTQSWATPSAMMGTHITDNQNQGAPNPKSVSSVVHSSRSAPSASIVSTNIGCGRLGAPGCGDMLDTQSGGAPMSNNASQYSISQAPLLSNSIAQIREKIADGDAKTVSSFLSQLFGPSRSNTLTLSGGQLTPSEASSIQNYLGPEGVGDIKKYLLTRNIASGKVTAPKFGNGSSQHITPKSGLMLNASEGNSNGLYLFLNSCEFHCSNWLKLNFQPKKLQRIYKKQMMILMYQILTVQKCLVRIKNLNQAC